MSTLHLDTLHLRGLTMPLAEVRELVETLAHEAAEAAEAATVLNDWQAGRLALGAAWMDAGASPHSTPTPPPLPTPHRDVTSSARRSERAPNEPWARHSCPRCQAEAGMNCYKDGWFDTHKARLFPHDESLIAVFRESRAKPTRTREPEKPRQQPPSLSRALKFACFDCDTAPGTACDAPGPHRTRADWPKKVRRRQGPRRWNTPQEAHLHMQGSLVHLRETAEHIPLQNSPRSSPTSSGPRKKPADSSLRRERGEHPGTHATRQPALDKLSKKPTARRPALQKRTDPAGRSREHERTLKRRAEENLQQVPCPTFQARPEQSCTIPDGHSARYDAAVTAVEEQQQRPVTHCEPTAPFQGLMTTPDVFPFTWAAMVVTSAWSTRVCQNRPPKRYASLSSQRCSRVSCGTAWMPRSDREIRTELGVEAASPGLEWPPK